MLRFGTSGIPHSTRRPGTDHGIRRAREMGLDRLEMAWVNGVRMGNEAANRIAAAARATGLELTAHGPYYVNLCGSAEVVQRSLDRLLHTARMAERCGAHSFCFHAGFYQTLAPVEADRMVREGLAFITAQLRRESVRVDVRPELTGKPTQVGSRAVAGAQGLRRLRVGGVREPGDGGRRPVAQALPPEAAMSFSSRRARRWLHRHAGGA
jgi:deoxyribonuclease-4